MALVAAAATASVTAAASQGLAPTDAPTIATYARVFGAIRVLLARGDAGGGDAYFGPVVNDAALNGGAAGALSGVPLAVCANLWGYFNRLLAYGGKGLAAGISAGLWYLMQRPLANLYLSGPGLGGFGFWEGRSAPDVCVYVSGVGPTSFWEQPGAADACINLVAKKAAAFIIGTTVVLVTTTAVYAICVATWRVCCLNPILRTMRHVRYLHVPRSPRPVSTTATAAAFPDETKKISVVGIPVPEPKDAGVPPPTTTAAQ